MSALPGVAELLLNAPLYTTFAVEDADRDQLRVIINNEVQLDAYCSGCGKNSIFKFFGSRGGGAGLPTPDYMADRTFSISLSCSRDHSHVILFIFRLREKKLQKVGQYPSLADLDKSQYIRHMRSLHDADAREFSRALGLAAHGVGIGSFVYLRRIFERLVDEHLHKAAEAGQVVDEGRFHASRMDEKIDFLKGVLPGAVVENRGIYAILSKGVHELSEEECLQFFPLIRDAILLILERDMAEREEEKIAESIRKGVAALHSRLK